MKGERHENGNQNFVRETVSAKDGEYAVAATLEEELCRHPYEDLAIEYHIRPAGTSYADLAKIYRSRQLGHGVVKPFRERFRENKVLERAILSPEVRIRQAWKPVPSPVAHQAPENEPEVKAVVTFDRVKDIVDERIGWVPKKHNDVLALLMDAGKLLVAKVTYKG